MIKSNMKDIIDAEYRAAINKFSFPKYVYSEKAFFNARDIDKKFACGHVKADKGTLFVAKEFKCSNDAIVYCLVPFDEKYNIYDEKTGNPKFMLCFVSSESFYEDFVPYKTIGDSLCGDEDYHLEWENKWFLIQNICNMFKENPRYVGRILNTINDYNKSDPAYEILSNLVYTIGYKDPSNPGSYIYDVRLNRDFLYFTDDFRILSFCRDAIADIIKEAINESGNYPEPQAIK